MFGRKLVLAAVMAAAANAAQADSVIFSYSASAEEMASKTFNYLDNSLYAGALTTGGVQTITSGGVSASLNAWANPALGVFKSYTSVNISGAAQPVNIAESSVRLDVSDTLRFSGPGSTVNVTLTMNYDTTFAGVSMSPFPRYEQINHFLQVSSDRSVSLSYDIANPDFVPGAVCAGGEMPCPSEFITKTASAYKFLFKELALGGNGSYVYSNGDATNGNFSGVVTLTATLPTNTDITLNYFGYNGSRCFHMAECALETNALNSDYLSLTVDGGTYVSTSGFQYLGMAAAVPEPESYAMLLAGLGLIGMIVRRRMSGRR